MLAGGGQALANAMEESVAGHEEEAKDEQKTDAPVQVQRMPPPKKNHADRSLSTFMLAGGGQALADAMERSLAEGEDVADAPIRVQRMPPPRLESAHAVRL